MARPTVIQDEQIIRTARELFMRRGIHATEMKDIAAKCGISRSSLYRRFDSKESIAFAIAIEILEGHDAVMRRGTPDSGTGAERLAAALHALAAAMLEQPEAIRFLDDFDSFFADGYPESETARRYTEFNQRRSGLGLVGKILEQGAADGSLRAGLDPVFTERLYTNILLGVGQRVVPRAKILRDEQGYATEYLTEAVEMLLRDMKA